MRCVLLPYLIFTFLDLLCTHLLWFQTRTLWRQHSGLVRIENWTHPSSCTWYGRLVSSFSEAPLQQRCTVHGESSGVPYCSTKWIFSYILTSQWGTKMLQIRSYLKVMLANRNATRDTAKSKCHNVYKNEKQLCWSCTFTEGYVIEKGVSLASIAGVHIGQAGFKNCGLWKKVRVLPSCWRKGHKWPKQTP